MKITTILACSILVIFNAMQPAQQRPSKIKQKQVSIAPQQKNKKLFFRQYFEKEYQLPLFSLKEIAYSFAQLSIQDKQSVEKKSKPLIFAVALLPQDIRRAIIAKMLPGDGESIQLFDTLPMLTSFEYYQKIKSYDPSLRVGNKTYSVGRLFRLAISSPTKFDDLVAMGKPSIIDRLIVGKRYDLLTVDDCEKIPQMPKDIGEGLELKVINEDYMRGCRQIASCYCLVTGILFCINWPSIAGMFGCCIGTGCCCAHHHCIEQNAISVKL